MLAPQSEALGAEMSIHVPPPVVIGAEAWRLAIARFEAAPHEPDGWPAALRALAEAAGADAARLYATQGGERWLIADSDPSCGRPERLVMRVAHGPHPEVQLCLTGDTEAVERAGPVLAALVPAVRTQLTVEFEGLRIAVAMLRRAGLQPMVCGPDGALLHEAEPLRPGPLRLSAGRIAAVARDDDAALRTALREAVVSGRDRVLVLGRDSETPAVVDVLPPLAGHGHRFRPYAVVLLRGRVADGAQRAPILKQLYGLTAAEASIALAVTEGAPLGAIAARRGVAASTVRAQVKTIFAKVGVGRQVELVQRLAAVC